MIQSGLAVILVTLLGLPAPVAALITGILALVKTYLATRITTTGSASTLPVALAPVAAELAAPGAPA